VADAEHGLARDRQRRFLEQVMRLGDRADERALDRQDAELDLTGDRRLSDGGEARQCQDPGRFGEEPVARGGRVCSVPAGVGDADGLHVRLTIASG
jgi:hypothetical protein